ncbi:MAG: hypothetical protein RLZZ144_770 [Pseudomonadota bacterium]|jgi:hypothetical protein
MKLFWVIILLSGLAACTSYQAIYGGIKNNNDAQRTPNERANNPTPTYDQYKKFRDDL